MLNSGAVGKALFESGKHLKGHLKWYCLVTWHLARRSAVPNTTSSPYTFHQCKPKRADADVVHCPVYLRLILSLRRVLCSVQLRAVANTFRGACSWLQAFSLPSCRVLGPTAVCVEAKAMSVFSGNPYLYEVGEE